MAMSNDIMNSYNPLKILNASKVNLNEDASSDTGIPFLAMGGVFNRKAKGQGLQAYIDIRDQIVISKAIADFFALYPDPTDDQVHELAQRLNLTPSQFENVIYSVLSSFFHAGKWNENPNHPIDPDQLRMGIEVEMEHTTNPIIASRITYDHLTEDPLYYSHLLEQEKRYQNKK